jgi:MFS family permease
VHSGSPVAPGLAGPAHRPRRRGLVAALCAGGAIAGLQQTILVPVLPELPRLLGESADDVSWLVTATLLAAAVATPVTTRLADMYGRRRMALVCLATMLAGTLLGAVSGVLVLSIAARALQGVGMALIPIGIAIMRDELPAERVPLGVAVMSAALAVGGGAGLPLAGLVVQHADWHLLFWVSAASMALVLAAAVRVVPASPAANGGPFDLPGAVLLSLALVGGLLALTKGAQWGWGSPATLGCALGGAAVLAAWVPVELRSRRPLVDLRLATRPSLLLVNLASVFAGFGMFADPLVVTQFLQSPPATGYGLGLDTATTGLLLAPGSLAFAAAAPFSAFLTRRHGAAVTLLVGAACMAVAYAVRIWAHSGAGWVVGGSLLVSAGAAISFGAMPALVMQLVPRTETASANGLNSLVRSLGTSAASATVAAVSAAAVVRLGDTLFPSLTAIVVVLAAAAAASLFACAAVLPLVLHSGLARPPHR